MSNLLDGLANLFVNNMDEKEFASLPVSMANKIYGKNGRLSISNFVRPINYDVVNGEHNKIFNCNDGEYGVCIEITPRVRMGKDSSDTIADILENMPENLYMQISLYGLENVENFLQVYEREHKVRNDLVINELIDTFVNFYRSKTKTSLTKNIESNLKSLRLIVSLKSKSRKVLKKFADDIEFKLTSSSFYPQRIGKKELQEVYSELLNYFDDLREMPRFRRDTFFNKGTTKINQITQVENQYFKCGIIDDDGKFKGRYWKALALEDLSDQFSIRDFSDKLGFITGTRGQINKNQFKDNFIISFMITKANSQEISALKLNNSLTEKQMADDGDVVLKQQKEEVSEAKHKLGNEEAFFKTDIVVMVSGKSEEELNQNFVDVKSFWRKGDYKAGQLKVESANGVHHNIFLASLPMGINKEYFTKVQNRPYIWTSETASQFVPLEGAWAGNYPNLIGISRRNTLIGIDFHKSEAGRNGYVLGTTGAGKSVLLCALLLMDYSKGGRVFSIDIGASYENIIKALGGYFLQPDKASPISFNPFGLITTEEQLDGENGYRDFLASWLYLIGGNKDPQTFLKEQGTIKGTLTTVIKEVWLENKSKGIVTEPTHIRDRFLQIADENNGDRRYRDFATGLTAVSKGGTLYPFFSGVPDWDISQSDLVCFDFTKIQNDSALRDALIFVATFFFSEAVYKGDGNKTITFLIDEFHKHLGKNPHLDKEVDEAYRTYRKHEGSIITGTQGFNDLVDVISKKTKPVGEVIVTNSQWQIFGKQTQVAKNLVINSGLFDFDEFDIDAMSNPTGVKGEYSEFLIIDPDDNKVPVRFIFPYLFIVLSEASVKRKTYLAEVEKSLNLNRYEACKRVAYDSDLREHLEEIRRLEFEEQERELLNQEG